MFSKGRSLHVFEDENKEGYFNITINCFQELRAFSDMAVHGSCMCVLLFAGLLSQLFQSGLSLCWQGPTSTVLQGYRQEWNNRPLFCQISIASAIYMMSLNITAVSQQTKLSWAVKYTSIDQLHKKKKKIFPPILIGTVCHAFLHNGGCNNDGMGLMKYISKALNTFIAIF